MRAGRAAAAVAGMRVSAPALGCFALAAVVGLLSTKGVALTPIRADPSAVFVALRFLPTVFALCAPALVLVGLAHLWHGRARRRSGWEQPWVDRLVAFPPWVLVLPVSLGASYIVTRMNFSATTDAPFLTGFALWSSAIALFLLSFASRETWQGLRAGRFAPRQWFNLQQSDVGLIILLAVGAFALRIAFLDHAPLIHGDEETLGEESMRVLRGVIKNMFGAGWEGLPSLNFFVISIVYRVLGIGIFAVRFVSAVAGTAAVVVTYIAFRELFGRGRALVAALFMTAYHFHLQFSRTGFTNVGDTLVMPAAIYFTYRAARAQRPFDFAALGLVCGFGLYVYSTTRAVPLVMAVFFLLLIVFQRGFLRASWKGMLLALAAFCIVGLPIGLFFLSRPDVFAGRLSSVGVFWSGWYERQILLGNTPASILWDQVKHAFGVFVYYPVMSNAGLYQPSLPLIPGWSAVPFLIGAAYALFHVRRTEYLLVVLSLMVPTLLGGVLTIPATSWQRFLGTIPAVCAFVSIGLWQAASVVLFWRPSVVPAVAIVGVVVLAAQNAHIYFRSAMKDKVFGPPLRWVTVEYVRGLPRDTRVYWFGAPWAYAGLAATSLYDRTLVDVFDAAPHALLPVDHPSPSVYLFMAHREDELPALQKQCPGGTTRTLSYLGEKVLLVYELMSDNICLPKLEPPPANDRFENATVIKTVPFIDTLSTKAATLDEHEPQPGPPKPTDSLPCTGTNNTAWYAFTSDADVRLTARIVGTTSGTLIGLFEGTELTSLVPIACNAFAGPSDPRAAEIEFLAHAGVPYRLQVAAKSYAVGTETFTLAPTAPPWQPAEGWSARDFPDG